MRVIRRTPTFLWALLLAALYIGVAGLAPAFWLKAHYWKIPWRPMFWTAVIIATLLLPSLYLLSRGRRFFLKAIGTGWLILSIMLMAVSLDDRNVALGFYGIMHAAFCLGVWSWLKKCVNEVYFEPGVSWYQQFPLPIAGLECEVQAQEQKKTFRVGRVDRTGVFIFSPSLKPIQIEPQNLVNLKLSYRGNEMRCRGIPIRELGQSQGWGLKFTGMSIDEEKLLGDFVESLRGEGHA